MSEMVDRVAAAMKDAFNRHDGKILNLKDWQEEGIQLAALAAIAAMREPTGIMYIMGANAIPGDPTTYENMIDYLSVAWKAMVDEALRD
jgi:hypothetical protein